MTLHLKSRGYPFRPRLLFSSFIVVGVGFPTVYYFRRGQESFFSSEEFFISSVEDFRFQGRNRLSNSSAFATRWRLIFRTFVSEEK